MSQRGIKTSKWIRNSRFHVCDGRQSSWDQSLHEISIKREQSQQEKSVLSPPINTKVFKKFGDDFLNTRYGNKNDARSLDYHRYLKNLSEVSGASGTRKTRGVGALHLLLSTVSQLCHMLLAPEQVKTGMVLNRQRLCGRANNLPITMKRRSQ